MVISAYNLRTWKTQARDSGAFMDSLDYRVRPYFRGKQCRIRNLAQLKGCCLACTKLWVEPGVVVRACDVSTWEIEVRGSGVQNSPLLLTWAVQG